ncbi:MAG: site-specific integrase, partial [Candidatus Sulfotelmatobacter sp.]
FMAILPITEKQGELAQLGGWQKEMARRRYQKGNIRKRGKRNPVWELQWWTDCINPDGTIGRKRESIILGPVASLTRRQALKAAEEHLRPLNLGKVTPFSAISFRELVDKYFVPNFFPTLKLSTQRRYRRTLEKHLLPAFGDSRLCDIGTLDLQQFVLQKMAGGLGWECADHYRNLMSKIFVTAKKWGFFATDNPAIGVELPEKKAVREKHVLLPEQILALLAALEEPARTMVLVGVLTGLRVGEILGLRWRDVDFNSGEIRVEQACYRGLIGTPKTKNSRRILPMPDSLKDELKHLREKAASGEHLVFQTRNGTPFSDTNLLHQHLKPVGKKLGMPWLNWHTLRRTHATLFQQAGGTLREAQAQLGHSKMSTTLEIYTISIPQAQRKAVENLSDLVTNGDELAKLGENLPLASERIQ